MYYKDMVVKQCQISVPKYHIAHEGLREGNKRNLPSVSTSVRLPRQTTGPWFKRSAAYVKHLTVQNVPL